MRRRRRHRNQHRRKLRSPAACLTAKQCDWCSRLIRRLRVARVRPVQVRVQIVIDENGNVVSAAPVSGHPLLQGAAVAAARASKFTPTKLSGMPVKVSGVIIYNFVAQ